MIDYAAAIDTVERFRERAEVGCNADDEANAELGRLVKLLLQHLRSIEQKPE